MLIFPNAKINLGLNIIEKRDDGFHNISSCFYPIKWHDVIDIVEAKKISFSTSGIEIPGNPGDNLCVKAFQLLQKDFHLPDVAIHLHKIVPVGAGLGGGSSDASFVLKALNQLFQLFLDDEILISYAERLGSDCPFFIPNKPVIGEGKGEVLNPVNLDLSGYHILIIHPGIIVDTKSAYENIHPAYPEISIREIIENNDIAQWKDYLRNDFEVIVFKKYPVIMQIKEILYGNGAQFASMSGSGSAVYGIFDKPPEIKIDSKYTVWASPL